MTFTILIFLLLQLTSCKKLAEVDLPKDRIDIEKVFATDANAIAAISGLYQDLGNGFAGGNDKSVTMLAALSSDEIRNYYPYYPDWMEFEENEVTPANTFIQGPAGIGLWSGAYKIIYQANSILERINISAGISPAIKTQLEGEAYFFRAFAHFYLRSLFGDVPIILTTDYRQNAITARSPAAAVDNQILKDLIVAKQKLAESYPTTERVRVNKSTARALLARYYLYQRNWPLAEEESSAIILQNDVYTLTALNDVFLKNSNEAIWQWMPTANTINTFEGNVFIASGAPGYFVLRDELINAFEPGDERRTKWVDSLEYLEETLYYPYKYKVKQGSILSEYSMIFRLGEQYLIRAEARAQQNKLPDAVEDLDMIRDRAHLPLIQDINPSILQEDLLSLIYHERQIELFTEWGHRWLDLIRTQKADQVLGAIKPTWKANAKLYPIPQVERQNNPFLGAQNPGY